MGYSPYSHKELDITATKHTHQQSDCRSDCGKHGSGLGKGILGKVMDLQGPEGPM